MPKTNRRELLKKSATEATEITESNNKHTDKSRIAGSLKTTDITELNHEFTQINPTKSRE
jgi:uncharacterized protein YehS (DUF1456 family)